MVLCSARRVYICTISVIKYIVACTFSAILVHWIVMIYYIYFPLKFVTLNCCMSQPCLLLILKLFFVNDIFMTIFIFQLIQCHCFCIFLYYYLILCGPVFTYNDELLSVIEMVHREELFINYESATIVGIYGFTSEDAGTEIIF